MAENKTLRIKQTERQPSIDLLRFIAAMMVATMHWGHEVGSERYQRIYDVPLIGDLVKNGSFGVNIFFVISGFVIIGTAQKYNAIEFIFARFSRLFPGLLISMLIVLIVGSYFIHSYEKPFSSFFHSIFLTYQAAGVQPLATPLWTLIIEIKFYIGVAIALFFFPRFFKSTKGIIILLTSWELIIILLGETTTSIGTYLLPYITLNGSNNLFALGICFNLLSKVKIRLVQENLLLSLISLYFINEVFLVDKLMTITKLYMIIASLMIIFSKKIVLHPSLQKFSYWLGLSSYLIYLLHEHLGMAFVLQLQAHVTKNIILVIGFAVTLITIVSVLLAIYIEKPIQRFLKGQFQKFYLKH
jgi:peptidoglycan/LPS O-acetylase OafA/YrhL